jgi:hypothetical protein
MEHIALWQFPDGSKIEPLERYIGLLQGRKVGWKTA